jgi:dihydroorotase
MQVLLKSARIMDGSTENRKQDILIHNGRIESIEEHISTPKGATVWESPNLCVSPGWLDVGVYAADPGYEHREDLNSAAAAAAAGGFTAMACFPNTDPALAHQVGDFVCEEQGQGLTCTLLSNRRGVAGV